MTTFSSVVHVRRAGVSYSMPSGPCEAPTRNWRTNWFSELNSSSAGPDSTIRPRHSTETARADVTIRLKGKTMTYAISAAGPVSAVSRWS